MYEEIRDVEKEGYILHLPAPVTSDQDHLWMHGLKYDYDADGKKKVWILFKASVIHLSAHVSVSDFSIYYDFRRSKEPALANFIISLIEDIRVTHFLKSLWSGVMPTISAANHICYPCLKKGPILGSPIRVVASDLLSAMISSNLQVSGPVGNATRTILDALKDLERNTESRRTPFPLDSDQTFILNIAEHSYSTMEPLGKIFETPALPYTESYGRSTIFAPSPLFDQDEVVARVGEGEADQVWMEREAFQEKENRILEVINAEIGDSRIKTVTFPNEDLVEYLRERDDLSGTIARIGSQLGRLTNVYDDDPHKTSGVVDLSEAIEVLAAGREAEEVFQREERILRSQSLAILIDMSKSVHSSHLTSLRVGIILAEVANRITRPPNSWGMFGFNDNFYVIKDFDERFGRIIKGRIGGIKQGGVTLTPDALRIVENRQMVGREEQKTIVLVTDGTVAGYSGISEDLRETVLRLAKSGIDIIAVDLQSKKKKSPFFKYFTYVKNPFDLAKGFVGAYMSLFE